MKKLRRSMLFMPGNNPGMLQNADILGADSIILDLEDAVNITEKDSARILVREALKNIDYSNVEVVVRINPLDTDFGLNDINAIARMKPDAFMIPKACEKQIREVDNILDKIEIQEKFDIGSIKLIPLIETAYGLETVYDVINASKRIIGILLGGEDLTSDFGIKRTKKGDEILYARNRISTVCRASKIDAIDTPFTDIDDYEVLKEDTIRAKNLGMTGKAAINPRQIDTIHSVFAPTKEEIDYAIKVLNAKNEAEKEGKGVFSLNGKMVDAPIINRARTTYEIAKMLNLI